MGRTPRFLNGLTTRPILEPKEALRLRKAVQTLVFRRLLPRTSGFRALRAIARAEGRWKWLAARRLASLQAIPDEAKEPGKEETDNYSTQERIQDEVHADADPYLEGDRH